MRGLTHRKLTIIRLAGYHTGWSAWHFHHINFPESLAMGLAPMLGEIPGSGQPNRHTPRLAGAVQEWRRGHSLPPGTPHRWQKPVSTGLRPRAPIRLSRRRVLAGGLRPVAAAGRRLILRAIRRYARSCCATAPPSQRLGAAPLRRAVLFLLERPPVLGSPAVDPRGELSE